MNERAGLDGTRRAGGDDAGIARDVNAREEMALRLTLEAIRNTQRALMGILALPTSIALGVAATVSYTAAFVERGFQTFELSLSRMARDAELLMGDRTGERPLFGGTSESSELTKTARS
jgi:hypothetical protein